MLISVLLFSKKDSHFGDSKESKKQREYDLDEREDRNDKGKGHYRQRTRIDI